MKNALLTILRDKTTSMQQFRDAADKLSSWLAIETATLLEQETFNIETPLAKAIGHKLTHSVTLVPILRSGIAMLQPFLRHYSTASVGFVGIRRDEKAMPHLYYQNLPPINPDDDVIILDPMIATGGSAITAIKVLKDAGVKEGKIMVVGILGSPEGLQALESCAPDARFLLAQVDQKLDDKKFILPGLGDFGDRYFGTLSQ